MGDKVEIKLASGQVLTGRLHADFKEGIVLEGRALDLEKAFKQVPVAPAFLPFAVVAAWHPGRGCLAYYLLRALPFGARNAVYVFGCIARTIEYILTTLFWIHSGSICG